MNQIIATMLESGKKWAIVFVGLYITLSVLFATVLGNFLGNWLKVAPDISTMIQWFCGFVGGGGAIKSIADVLPKLVEVMNAKKNSGENTGSTGSDSKTTGAENGKS